MSSVGEVGKLFQEFFEDVWVINLRVLGGIFIICGIYENSLESLWGIGKLSNFNFFFFVEGVKE